VSPDEIDQVTRIWRSARADEALLADAVGERLAGTAEFRADRAR